MKTGYQRRTLSLAAAIAIVALAAIAGLGMLGMMGCSGSPAVSSSSVASNVMASSASSQDSDASADADAGAGAGAGADADAGAGADADADADAGADADSDADAEADTSADAEATSKDEGDANTADSEYTMRFNDYGYSDAFYMPGDPLTLKVSLVTYDEALEDAVDVDATFEWDVDPKLGAQVEGDTMTVRSMPEVGSYPMSVTARDKDGKELLVEKHIIEVKDAPEPSLVVQLEEDASKVDTCKTDDYLAILLKGCQWEWISAEGYRLDWQVKDLKSGKVYDDSTNLTDLDAKHNGGIEAESFGNYKWPAMMAIFGTPGDYEITATLVTAAGKEISSSATLHVK